MSEQGLPTNEGLPEYRYPDFLCIGAQKAGTTWLDSNLRRHPKLWLPPMKELQFFSHLHIPAARRWTGRQRHERGTQALKRYMDKTPREEWNYRHIARIADLVAGPITDDWYGRMFALAGPQQVCGEVTPDYCTLPDEGIAHVLRLSPDVRIILSLRDPIERSWSHIRMTARMRGIADVESLERFARQADQLQRGNYPAIVARWRKFIPEDRFLVIFMDDIVSRPTEVLREVCGFLKVPYREKPFAKAANPVHVGEAQAIPPPVLAALKEGLAGVYDEMAALYPEPGAAWRARHFGA